jgi:flavin-binding protein dodecin
MSRHIANVIEIIGSSDQGWEGAAQVAIDEAKKTLHGIHGIEVLDMTATVDPRSGKITNYKTCVKVSFAVD